MKLKLTALTLLTTINASAASLEAVECKRELIAGALSTRVQDSTLEGLLSSTYEVTNFDNTTDLGSYPYVVTIEDKSRLDGTTVTLNYAVKVVSTKNCAVKAKLLAD